VEARHWAITAGGEEDGMREEDEDDPFLLERLRLPGGVIARRVVPEKVRRRRRHFVMLPMAWYDRLKGANGQTCRVAWYLLYLHWKDKGEPVKLNNGMLETDGVSRQSKWKALADLERRGLVAVERRPKRSPIVRLLHT
jgi:hypothetical protein